MSDVVKVGWSGGKDSSCAVMKHIQRGDKVKAVCYIPMFTREIPLILRDHHEFILRTADYFRSLGAEVFFADKGLTYYEYVIHPSLKGKHKGRIFGFPCIGIGILSPQYTYEFGKKHNRDGCALCYNATERERKAWFRDYPEAIPLVIELQNIVKQKRPDNRPLRNYKWFIDD